MSRVFSNTEKLLIEYMCKTGLTDAEIAKKLEMDIIEYICLKQDDKELLERIEVARKNRIRDVEDSLFKRAVGYEAIDVHETIYSDGRTANKVIKRDVSPDVGAIKFYLSNMAPDMWKDRTLGDKENPINLVTLIQSLDRDSSGETDKLNIRIIEDDTKNNSDKLKTMDELNDEYVKDFIAKNKEKDEDKEKDFEDKGI